MNARDALIEVEALAAPSRKLPHFLVHLQKRLTGRRILYVLVSPRGRVRKITVKADTCSSIEWLLEHFAPNQHSPPRLHALLKAGWSLSNWHVIWEDAL